MEPFSAASSMVSTDSLGKSSPLLSSIFSFNTAVFYGSIMVDVWRSEVSWFRSELLLFLPKLTMLVKDA